MLIVFLWESALTPARSLAWKLKGLLNSFSSAAQGERFSTLEMLITERIHVAQRIFRNLIGLSKRRTHIQRGIATHKSEALLDIAHSHRRK